MTEEQQKAVRQYQAMKKHGDNLKAIAEVTQKHAEKANQWLYAGMTPEQIADFITRREKIDELYRKRPQKWIVVDRYVDIVNGHETEPGFDYVTFDHEQDAQDFMEVKEKEAAWGHSYNLTTTYHNQKSCPKCGTYVLAYGDKCLKCDHQTEATHGYDQRKLAARKWANEYAEEIRRLTDLLDNKHKDIDTTTATTQHEKALLVMLLTPTTSDYLADNDPQALKQAQVAVSGKSWEDFM